MSRQRKSLGNSRRLIKNTQTHRVVDHILTAFRELSEPAQVILVIGIVLLLAWILTHPVLLQDIIKALQLWFLAKRVI
jgi:hypothetical protein